MVQLLRGYNSTGKYFSGSHKRNDTYNNSYILLSLSVVHYCTVYGSCHDENSTD